MYRLEHVADGRGLVRALAALVLLSVASPAAAQESPSDSRARVHFQSGAVYYDAGEYEAALREFQSAYDLSERQELFYNMYLCEQALGNLDAAAQHLAAFLENVAEIGNRASLEMRLSNLRERIARRAAGEADPGPSEEVEALETTTIEREVAVSEPTAQTASPNVPAIVGFSVAGLGLVGAAIFGPLALTEDSSLASSCGETRTCTEAQTSALGTYALVTDISLAVALAGAIAGTVLLVTVSTDERDTQAFHIVPFAADRAAGVAIGGAF